MRGRCATCGRALKESVAVVRPNAGPERIWVCKSPICERYMQPQDKEE